MAKGGKNQGRKNGKKCSECRYYNQDECPFKGLVKQNSVKSDCKYR